MSERFLAGKGLGGMLFVEKIKKSGTRSIESGLDML